MVFSSIAYLDALNEFRPLANRCQLAYIDALSEPHPLIMTNLNYVFFSTCENFFDLGYLILDRP